MGGMHALEWALQFPGTYSRLALIATCAITSADQLGGNSLQTEAIRVDSLFAGGDFYDQAEGPYRGLALARRMALINYRSPSELNERFEERGRALSRHWETKVDSPWKVTSIFTATNSRGVLMLIPTSPSPKR